MVLFVASDEASFSTGWEFIVDGGVLLGRLPDSSPIRLRGTDSETLTPPCKQRK